jgi:hypothetical protein
MNASHDCSLPKRDIRASMAPPSPSAHRNLHRATALFLPPLCPTRAFRSRYRFFSIWFCIKCYIYSPPPGATTAAGRARRVTPPHKPLPPPLFPPFSLRPHRGLTETLTCLTESLNCPLTGAVHWRRALRRAARRTPPMASRSIQMWSCAWSYSSPTTSPW